MASKKQLQGEAQENISQIMNAVPQDQQSLVSQKIHELAENAGELAKKGMISTKVFLLGILGSAALVPAAYYYGEHQGENSKQQQEIDAQQALREHLGYMFYKNKKGEIPNELKNLQVEQMIYSVEKGDPINFNYRGIEYAITLTPQEYTELLMIAQADAGSFQAHMQALRLRAGINEK